jgi:alpha-tubulin suppressor-like RCC1 family protein
MAYCWGDNQDGKLGDGTLTSRAAARPVSTTERFKSISTAGQHSCGINLTGVAFCWGRNIWAQLGIGEVPYQNTGAPAVMIPTAVSTTVKFTTIGAGDEFTCALAESGRAYCWGRDENASQLGDRNPGSVRGTPGLVADDHAFVSLSVGDIASCGITSAGASWCWGDNYFGTLTDPAVVVGGGIDFPVPTRGSPYLAVSVGGSHACGIRPDHHLFCWGDSYYGQVGAQ